MKILKKYYIFLIVILTAAAGVTYYAVGYSRKNTVREDLYTVKEAEEAEKQEQQTEQEEVPTEKSKDTIIVHVCGAVNKPSVYTININDRVIDAVRAAEGFCEGAAEEYINLAMPLKDGQRIYIPFLTDISEAELNRFNGIEVSEQSEVKRVNINTADIEELTKLSGIKEARAIAIIKYREQNGAYKSIEDIMQVSGIKQSMFDTIKDFITVD